MVPIRYSGFADLKVLQLESRKPGKKWARTYISAAIVSLKKAFSRLFCQMFYK